MKILSLLFVFFNSIVILTSGANAATSTLYQDLVLPLPRACLPIEGRMMPENPSNMNDQHCHCPPKSFCTQKVTYSGKEYNKLSNTVKKICCTAEQTCKERGDCRDNTLLITAIAPKECEVHYFKYSNTNTGANNCNPPENTHVGTRSAGYCIAFNATTPSLTSLNQCLGTCESFRTGIKNSPGFISNYNSMESNTKANQTASMINQIKLKEFVTCRRNCFNASGFNNGINTSANILMPQHEIDINKWIMLPFVDNATDEELKSGITEYDTLHNAGYTTGASHKERGVAEKIKTFSAGDSRLKHFTAKIYGPIVTHVLNQRDGLTPNSLKNPFIDWFFKNTYNLSKNYTNLDYKLYFNSLEEEDFNNQPLPDGNKNQVDYFNRQMNNPNITPKFKTLAYLRNTSEEPAIPAPPVGCTKYAYTGMCITVWTNSSGCETCLAPETKITMADGTYTLIKDLKTGDRIKAPNDKVAQIENIASLDWKNLTLYNINNGQLRLTADHPIMTKDGWRAINYTMRKHNDLRYGLKKVKTLKIGDIIITENGNVPVTRIISETSVENGKTFNLKLKDNIKGFYANGVLVRSQN